MKMTHPALPRRRAFVVQLHADARLEQGEFYGRVEHLDSYQAIHFQSLDELRAFMARVIATQEQTTTTDRE